MKILQLIQKPQLRGAEMFASQLSSQLMRAGHEVHVVSLFKGDASLPFKGNHIRLNRPHSKRFFDFTGWKTLAQQIKSIKPDVVQANAGDTLKFAVFSKLLFGWRSAIIFRNANKVSDFVDSSLKKYFNLFLISYVDYVVSVSELCKNDFISVYQFDQKKISCIPIGIDTVEFYHGLPYDLVNKLGGKKYIVHVGSFVSEKNHLNFLGIFHRILKLRDDLHLVLIGDGALRQQIEEMILQLGIQDRVHLLGYRNDVLSIVSSAKMLVLPSNIEGLPGVILEAMYSRIAVVAYDVGGVSEVVENNRTGWLVKKGDENSFYKCILEVLEHDEASLARITNNAYELVCEKFDNSSIVNQFLAVYALVGRSG